MMNLSQTSGNFFHYPGAWAPGYLNVASPLSVLEIAGGGADAKWLKKKADTKAETN